MYEKSHNWDAVYKALQRESDEMPDLETTVVQGVKKTHSLSLYYDPLEHIFDSFLNRLKTKARSKLWWCIRWRFQLSRNLDSIWIKLYCKFLNYPFTSHPFRVQEKVKFPYNNFVIPIFFNHFFIHTGLISYEGFKHTNPTLRHNAF